MPRTALLITHQVRPGRRDAVRAVWERHMAPAIAANPGHEAYVLCLDPSAPDAVCAFQVHRSPEDAAAFLATEAYRAYEREVAALLVGPPEVKPLTPVWSKTTPA
jgi:quinol monooxygenase YgiN